MLTYLIGVYLFDDVNLLFVEGFDDQKIIVPQFSLRRKRNRIRQNPRIRIGFGLC
jgi:hypothetical protein